MPTIILQHNINGFEFYKLYGHLSLASIENLQVGELFSEGHQIATLGDASVNGDYPGVCSEKDLAFYMKDCPNPNLLLKI